MRNAHKVLGAILEDAVRDRMLVTNPARGVKLPQRPPQRHVYLTADQLARLADESGRYCGLVLLLGVGGLRWGERLRCECLTWIFCAAGRGDGQRSRGRRHAQGW